MSLIEQSWWILMSSLACERGTELIHDSKFFLPLRNFVAKLAYPVDKPPAKWWHFRRKTAMFFSAAMGCGYCTSVWVAMPFAVWLSHKYVDRTMVGFAMGLITRLLVIHGLSNSIHVVYSRMQKGMVKAYDIVHTVKSEEPEYHQVTDPDKQTDGEFNIVHTVKSEEPEYQQVTDPDKQTDGEFNQAKWGADVL